MSSSPIARVRVLNQIFTNSYKTFSFKDPLRVQQMGHLQKPVYPFHFIWVIFIITISCQDSDNSALLEFQSSLKDPAGVLSGWDLSNSDHCSWIGVTCGSRDGMVYGINITGGGDSGEFTCLKYDMYSLYGFGVRKTCHGNGFKLSGKLSVSLSKFTELRVLSLPFNDLSGEIPDEIWGMEKLEVIYLQGNLITRSLTYRFSGSRSLRVLNLAFNKVSGEIPEGLSKVKSLQLLNLAGNSVNGSIPVFLDVFGI